MIAIVDYGIGNLGAIQNMFKKIRVNSIITSNKLEISNASKLILPGVGSFDVGMRNLKASGLLSILQERVLVHKIPVLGICLGMQILGNSSEEGIENGLGWIKGHTKKFRFSEIDKELRIPHMGWNTVIPIKQNPLINGLNSSSRFYFVHSYYFESNDPSAPLLNCDYGLNFCCAVQQENIYGVQFHPEKSHKFGMQLLQNFSSL